MATKAKDLENLVKAVGRTYGVAAANLPDAFERFCLNIHARHPDFSQVLDGDDWKTANLSEYLCGGGLHLRPDGAITRFVAGEELSWETLSGGERIWARLVTHLLVIEGSTRLPFAWFDEPLEHLDPKLRRTVAGYLATAAGTSGPAQLIVTTYEHTLVSQLAEDNDGTHIVFLR